MTLGRGKVCCGLFIAFVTADGLDSDGECIYGKGSLQEGEMVAVVPVGRFHVGEEQSHTPTSRQVQTKQTSSPRDPPVIKARQRNNPNTPGASEKELMDLSNAWVPEKPILKI